MNTITAGENQLKKTGSTLISHNYLHYSSGERNGIGGVGGAIISENCICGPATYGIYGTGSVEVRGNRVVENGIYLAGSSIVASANIVESGSIICNGTSTSADNAPNVLSDNLIKNGCIVASGAAVVSGNSITAPADKDCIEVEKGSNLDLAGKSFVVSGNFCNGGMIGVRLDEFEIAIPAQKEALVIGNRLYGQSVAAIQIESNWSGCMVTGNMLNGPIVDNGTGNIIRLNSDDTGGGGGGSAGVSTFNGRAGAVVPLTGDYTADMVGAIPSGAVTAIQSVTQAEYDALAVKNPSTLYLIKE